MKLNETAFASHSMEISSNKRRASVLIPLVEINGEDHILFEVRSSHIRQPHEISFPGGRNEEGESTEETAVRECMEELMIERSDIDMICPLHTIQGPRGIMVSSYLGRLNNYQNTYSSSEVDHVFTVPLETLVSMTPETGSGRYIFEGEEGFPYEYIPHGREYPFSPIERTFLFYKTGDGMIWGLTADLLSLFLSLLK